MRLESFLEESARHGPSREALVCGTVRLTYGDIETHANRLAHALIRAGLQRGDRVAICLDNRAEAVVAIFAALKAGAAFMPINPTTKPDKLLRLLNHAEAACLVADFPRLSAIEDAWPRMDAVRIVVPVGRPRKPLALGGRDALDMEAIRRDDALPADPPPKRAIDLDLAALIYTSGSTGVPKGVMLRHSNMVAAFTSIVSYLRNTPDDVILSVLPLAFGYGLGQVFTGFKAGARVVLERDIMYPHEVLTRLVAERATGMPIVPTISALLLQLDLERYDLSSLRYITNAGAALPPSHAQALRERLPHVRLFAMYGQTECTRASYLEPEELQARPTSVGKGIPNQEFWLIDDRGDRVGPHVAGELVVRGSHVMAGYWKMPELTDQKLRPGPLPGERVLHTGDLFRLDDDGYLYFVSRKDDIIKTRGEKVSPKEIEDVLYGIPDVAEAAVVGVPDPVLGQAVKAVIVPRAGKTLDAQGVLRACARQLEDFMMPKYLSIRSELPKTQSGKILKTELADEPLE